MVALIADRANQNPGELIIPKRKEAGSRGVRVTVWESASAKTRHSHRQQSPCSISAAPFFLSTHSNRYGGVMNDEQNG